MDLIYSDENRIDQGIIQDCAIDFEASSEGDKCTFQISTSSTNNPLKKGYYVHIEGTEYGGRIDTIKVDTAKNTIYASGRTFRGILASKIIEPPEGQAYRSVSGNLKAVLTSLIELEGLGDLFEVMDSSLNVPTFQFNRYISLYEGLLRLANTNALKLKLEWYRDKVRMSMVPRDEYTRANGITSDLFDFKITSSTPINHMIGLGTGELTERQVVHRYLDADGNVSSTQTFTGLLERVATYDDTSVESLEDLTAKTEEKLKDNVQSDQIELTAKNLDADIGDLVEASDAVTGISVTRYVTNKILTVEKQITKIQYKVGATI